MKVYKWDEGNTISFKMRFLYNKIPYKQMKGRIRFDIFLAKLLKLFHLILQLIGSSDKTCNVRNLSQY